MSTKLIIQKHHNEEMYKKKLIAVKKYAGENPHVNNKATKKWEENNIKKSKIIKRTSWRGTRAKILELWGPTCKVCGRNFTEKGMLRTICHHIQYEPVEHIVVVCNQCHNLIHGRRCFRHPFFNYSVPCDSIFLLALSSLEMLDCFIKVVHNGTKWEKGRYVRTTEVIKIEKTAIDLDKGVNEDAKEQT